MIRRACLALCAAALLASAIPAFSQSGAGLPPAEPASLQALEHSTRHGEWLSIDAGGGDKVASWIVYPERSDRAPVVLVVHEIYGLTDWVRAVVDQLAAEGFIAVAPDLLSGKAPGGKGSSVLTADQARELISQLDRVEITRRLDAVSRFVTALPSANGNFAVAGFCWGGGISFAYATAQPGLKAAVVCYGTPPDASAAARIKAPVLGLYGGADARVTSTVAPTAALMRQLGKSYEYEIYDGAGHAFFRQQDAQAGANLAAARKGWPRMVEFLKRELGSTASIGAKAAAPMLASFVDSASGSGDGRVTCACDGD